MLNIYIIRLTFKSYFFIKKCKVNSLEREKYTASLVLAYKISKYFNLTIEDVFDFSDLGEM